MSSTIQLEENSCLAFDKANDIIIVGGDAFLTRNEFYKMKFESGSFIKITKKRFGNYVKDSVNEKAKIVFLNL